MNIMKSATVTRVQVGCHEGSGQDRCRGRERSQDHKLIHHSRLISWAGMTISSWEKLALQPFAQGLPVATVDFFHHDFDHGNAVLLCPAAALPQALSRRPQKAGRAAEPLRQLFKEPSNKSLSIGCPLPFSFWRRISTR